MAVAESPGARSSSWVDREHDSIVRPLPSPERRGQDAAAGRRHNRVRDRRFHVGDRSRGRTGVSGATKPAWTGRGRSNAEELPSLAMWPARRPPPVL